MTKHHDESMALAALFDCWTPTWKKINGPYGFRTDIRPALGAFGFDHTTASPFYLARSPSFESCRPEPGPEEAACLLNITELRSPWFLGLFRRRAPSAMVLAAKSGLWWAIWDKRGSPSETLFDISTAEYIPSKNRA